MVLGLMMTVLNIVFNIVLIAGLGPFPALGTTGAAIGTAFSAGLVGVYSLWRLWREHTRRRTTGSKANEKSKRLSTWPPPAPSNGAKRG